jgi:methionyl-tRNA formyltransferase
MGGVFNYALYEKLTDWGCSAHFVDATFDTGDIIKTNRFSIQDIDTIPSLTKLSHIHMLTLLKEVINIIMKNKTTPELIPRVKQGKGRYISKKDLDLLREIKLDDSIQEIDNKIKSCFCPPHHGAYITIKDKQYSIINSEMLNKININ